MGPRLKFEEKEVVAETPQERTRAHKQAIKDYEDLKNAKNLIEALSCREKIDKNLFKAGLQRDDGSYPYILVGTTHPDRLVAPHAAKVIKEIHANLSAKKDHGFLGDDHHVMLAEIGHYVNADDVGGQVAVDEIKQLSEARRIQDAGQFYIEAEKTIALGGYAGNAIKNAFREINERLVPLAEDEKKGNIFFEGTRPLDFDIIDPTGKKTADEVMFDLMAKAYIPMVQQDIQSSIKMHTMPAGETAKIPLTEEKLKQITLESEKKTMEELKDNFRRYRIDPATNQPLRKQTESDKVFDKLNDPQRIPPLETEVQRGIDPSSSLLTAISTQGLTQRI